ncbi:hypothetical protein [Streptomyces shenzhenensis]|uniref:hypothetical protein n=1 Tax=Streptomyces shenzhenensis TaxID=943815 RepID=UPI0033C65DEB
MGSQDQTTRKADLMAAVAAHNEQQRQAAAERGRAEREEADKQAAADAALYNTAGWETLSDLRRHRASQYAAQQAQGGAGDAA